MRLTEEEYYQYLDLHPKLIYFVGKRLKKISSATSLEDFKDFLVEDKLPIRNLLYENIHLVDEFIKENASQLSAADKAIIKGFKHFKKGTFYVVKLLKKYALFMGKEYVYGVSALNDPFQMFWGNNLPVMVEAILLPFNDKIIYDGIISSYPIHLGRGIRNSVNNDVTKSKAKYGVITTLPEKIDKSLLENSAEKELLILMKTKSSREYNWYEIQDLLTANPKLMPVYTREWGRINSRKKKKELKKLGIKKQHFALYEDTIIASDANLNNLKERVSQLIPDKSNQAAIFYFKL